MTSTPSLTCPQCIGKLEYQVTIEMLDPPIGKIDTGYCPTCSRLFERIRQTGAYESTLWPPLCRLCRQPVSFADVGAGDAQDIVGYHCREHLDERWEWTRSTDQWTRRS
jgi:hypothetical protein